MKSSIRNPLLVLLGLLFSLTSLRAQKDNVTMDDMRLLSITQTGDRQFTVAFTATTLNEGPAFTVEDAFGTIYKHDRPLISGSVTYVYIPEGEDTVSITAEGTFEPGTGIIELIALYVFRRKEIYTLDIRFTETVEGCQPVVNDWKDLYWKDFKHKNH